MDTKNNKKPLNSRPLTAADLGIGKSEKPRQKPQGTRPNADPVTGGSKPANFNAAVRQNDTSSQNKPNNPKRTWNKNQAAQNKNGQNKNHNGNGQGQKRGNGQGRGSNPHAMRRRYDRGPAVFSEGSFNSDGNSKAQPHKPATSVTKSPVGLTKADAGKLKIIPLGGLDKIGKNMMALEYEDDIIVMDLGFMFPGPDMPGIDYIIPDTTYLEERKHKIRAHLITHAHEDHVGGIPFLLPKLPAPIYAAQFTIKYIERKLEEYKLPFKPEMRIIDQDSGQKIQLGAFSVEFIRITHSIPDACSIAIHTPVGTIINTGDWRFDNDPIDGKPSNKERLKELGDAGVLLLMCDSTSCEKMGYSPSEKGITDTLDEIFVRNYNKRVIVASFSSQVNRIQLIIDGVAKAKRKLAIVGRSLLANTELAVKMGYIKIPPGLLVKADQIKNIPDAELVVLATGSQGEEMAVLNRMGRGEHRDIKLKASDVVVLCSSIIPGNEKDVWGMVDNLYRWGPYVYQQDMRDFDDLGILHTSGHAYYDEVKEMIELVRPKYYLPIHGEVHHLVHNAEIAKRTGIIKPENIFVIENGQTLEATKDETIKLGPIVQSGSVLIDGSGIGDVQEIVLKDRLAMASDGVFTIIATVNRKTGKLVTSPDIISRGFIYVKDNEELMNKSRQIVKNVFAKRNPRTPANSPIVKNRIRDEISNLLYKVTKRTPIVLPVVIEV